uniref:prenyltransferase n=1 Tax=Prevotella sp. TaxID=59823 RepID=UPI00402545BC
MMKTIGLWFRIVRPQTLAASLCPVMAALIAMPSPVTSATVAAVTIVCALALQILSNLINDYYDFVRGTDQKGRAGCKRALADGEVSKRQMQWACLTALAV